MSDMPANCILLSETSTSATGCEPSRPLMTAQAFPVSATISIVHRQKKGLPMRLLAILVDLCSKLDPTPRRQHSTVSFWPFCCGRMCRPNYRPKLMPSLAQTGCQTYPTLTAGNCRTSAAASKRVCGGCRQLYWVCPMQPRATMYTNGGASQKVPPSSTMSGPFTWTKREQHTHVSLTQTGFLVTIPRCTSRPLAIPRSGTTLCLALAGGFARASTLRSGHWAFTFTKSPGAVYNAEKLVGSITVQPEEFPCVVTPRSAAKAEMIRQAAAQDRTQLDPNTGQWRTVPAGMTFSTWMPDEKEAKTA